VDRTCTSIAFPFYLMPLSLRDCQPRGFPEGHTYNLSISTSTSVQPYYNGCLTKRHLPFLELASHYTEATGVLSDGTLKNGRVRDALSSNNPHTITCPPLLLPPCVGVDNRNSLYVPAEGILDTKHDALLFFQRWCAWCPQKFSVRANLLIS
jgi:hypothetical protein